MRLSFVRVACSNHAFFKFFTVFLVHGSSRVQLLARRSGLPRIKSYSLALTTAVQAYPES